MPIKYLNYKDEDNIGNTCLEMARWNWTLEKRL